MHITNQDADASLFLESQLTVIENKAFEVPHPDLKAKTLFQVDYSLGDGVDFYDWISFDKKGTSSLLSSYSIRDLKRADISAKKNRAEIHTGGNSFGYTIDELKKCQRAGTPLEQKRADAALRANNELMEKICFYGDKERSIPGLLNHPNIPRLAASSVTIGSEKVTSWSKKSSQQILQDLHDLYNAMTNDIEEPNTLAIPSTPHSILSQRTYSDQNSITLIELFQKMYPNIKIERVNQLSKAGANGSDVIIFYNDSVDKIKFMIPVETEFLPPQPDGLQFVVPTRFRIAGLVVYFPMSLIIGEGY